MRAETLEEFLLAPPRFQQAMIDQQREYDRLQDKLNHLQELPWQDDKQRMELLRRCMPRWRWWAVSVSWKAYCWAMPRWAA